MVVVLHNKTPPNKRGLKKRLPVWARRGTRVLKAPITSSARWSDCSVLQSLGISLQYIVHLVAVVPRFFWVGRTGKPPADGWVHLTCGILRDL